jgi:peptide/nickel transport system permease protein
VTAVDLAVFESSGASSGAPRASGRPPRHQWLATIGRAARTGRGGIGLSLVALVVGVAAIGPFVAPNDPDAFVTSAPFAHSTRHNLLGGDVLARDVMSRLLDGGWVLLLLAASATALGVVLGAAAGVCAAYLGRRTDSVIMRAVDVVLAFPTIVLALLLVSILGPKLWLIVLAVSVSHLPQVARVVRSAALDLSERDFVKAVELEGISPVRVMTGEILPNLTTPIMVEAGLRLTYSIIIIAGLGFLGFGQPPPAPSWGAMINENRIGLAQNPWATAAPAAMIAVLAIGTNLFTDAISRASLGLEGQSA